MWKSFFLFLTLAASRHAARASELHDLWHGQSLPYSHLPLNHALPGSRSFRVGRLPLIRQRQPSAGNNCRYLIYNMPVLRRSGAAARLSCLHIPVETDTPPHFPLCIGEITPPDIRFFRPFFMLKSKNPNVCNENAAFFQIAFSVKPALRSAYLTRAIIHESWTVCKSFLLRRHHFFVGIFVTIQSGQEKGRRKRCPERHLLQRRGH